VALAVEDMPVTGRTPHAEAAVISLPVLPALHFKAPRGVIAEAEDGPEARIGSAMHRLLEWAVPDARDVDPLQVNRVMAEFRLDAEQARRAAAMALRILQGEGAWAWRSSELSWQGNEVPVTLQGSVRRIDRLVQRRDGSWWVLDYKSAAQPQAQEAWKVQLRGYRAAVQAASPGETVRAAFLSAQGTLEEME